MEGCKISFHSKLSKREAFHVVKTSRWEKGSRICCGRYVLHLWGDSTCLSAAISSKQVGVEGPGMGFSQNDDIEAQMNMKGPGNVLVPPEVDQ